MYQIKEYRGHIRNWKDLCGELNIDLSLDREAREQAILTAAYEKWGEKVGDHIYGMFAFALEDDETGNIFACRDQFGAKPFYYYLTEDGRLLYGTFIRQIMAQDGFVKELNEDMLQLYMTLTYVAGEDTFFKGVKKLLPGRTLTFKDGKLEIKRYFRPEFHPDNSKSLEQWADEIHTTVTHIMTEVKEPEEIAESFLSGGVDSSYVLAVSDVKNADTVGYDDERFDESPLAKVTADYLGVNLNRCRVTPEEYFAIVPWVMENMEQPLGDASAIAFALGCKATAQHTKLCYSGEGSDEFFGGYNMYRNAERYGENLKTFYVGNTNIMKEDEKKVLLKNYKEGVLPINLVEDIYKENEGADPLTKMQDVDIQIWLEGDIYFNVDKMSEAAGLEIRMPLTDLRVFDIASRMPSEYKVNAEQNKVAFRTAASKVIPEDVAFRKKLGFVVPIRHWMADPAYNKDVYEKLHGADAEKFFNKAEVEKIWDEYLGGNSDLWRKVWVIYTFLVWYDIYFN
ncbi:MAG: asparagine synthase-related protein [Lachnospiraceae bacterium]|nr:asparagine synthase-related protein [Lachnospiraceae bacterium]